MEMSNFQMDWIYSIVYGLVVYVIKMHIWTQLAASYYFQNR